MKYFVPTAIVFLFGCPSLAQEGQGRIEEGDYSDTFARAGGALVSQIPGEGVMSMPAQRLPDGTPQGSGWGQVPIEISGSAFCRGKRLCFYLGRKS